MKDILIACIVLPFYFLYCHVSWKCINKWEWTKKIANMENKIIPALFMILVMVLPILAIYLVALIERL